MIVPMASLIHNYVVGSATQLPSHAHVGNEHAILS